MFEKNDKTSEQEEKSNRERDIKMKTPETLSTGSQKKKIKKDKFEVPCLFFSFSICHLLLKRILFPGMEVKSCILSIALYNWGAVLRQSFSQQNKRPT